ncbi:MAG: ATP cone domain-containing protein [Candidatus Nanohalobium sp.]
MRIKVAKRNGLKEPLDEGKLWDSLYHPAKEAHYPEKEAVELADEVKHSLMDWMHSHDDNVFTTREIAERAEELLEERDDQVAVMYNRHLDIN